MHPIDGWRTVAPADCVGTPAVSVGYMNELYDLARLEGLEIPDGCTITASYEKVGGEWRPVAGSVRVGE